MQTKQHHRLLALLMTVVMVFQIAAIAPRTAFAEVTDTEITSGNDGQQNAAKAEGEPELRAIDPPTGTTTVLAFTSDIHNNSDNQAANRLDGWLDKVAAKHGGINLMGFCGDMGNAGAGESQFWTYTQSVMNVVEDTKKMDGVYTTGNHEFYNGKYSSTTNAVKQKYVVDAEGYTGSNFHIYCMGTDNWNNNSDNFTSDQVTKLTAYLNSITDSKPIIVLVHFPLHHYSSRTTANADLVIDALNSAANAGKKIVLLWGHNHTLSDQNYDQIFEPGDSIEYKSGSTKKIQFFYGAAGCMSDTENGTGSAYVKGKGLVITINDKSQLSFTYYDANANNVTEGGTYTEQDPVPITGASITETAPTVTVGKKIQLHYTVDPSDATVKTVTWSSSNAAVASVDSDGKVKGESEGTATITATISDGITRGTATASVQIEVTPRGAEPMYVLTDTLSPDKNYIIANKNDGEAYALTNNNGSISTTAVTIDGEVIYTDDENIVFTTEGEGTTVSNISNDGKYLSISSSSSGWGSSSATLSLSSSASSSRPWTYGTDNKLICQGSNNTYYLYYTTNSNTFSATTSATSSSGSSREVYIFEEVTAAGTDPVSGVTLNKSSLELKVGRSETLKATVSPTTAANKNVEWSTSNSSVATVSNGAVTAVGEGTATITVTTVDGGKTATCTVTVTRSTASTYTLVSNLEDGGEYLIVSANSGSAYALKNPGGSSDGTSIANTNNKTSVTIQTGSESYIETEDTDIVWTATANGSGFNLTNNGDYLEGASGSVSVFNPQKYTDRYWTYNSSKYLQHNGGQSTYTLRYSSNSNYFQGSTSNTSAVYLFKREGTDPVSGVTLTPASLNLETGDTAALTATVLPSTAGNKSVTWSSSNESVATVSNGTVTAVGAGDAVITVTTVDGGKTAQSSLHVTAAETVSYRLAETLEDGKEYIIADGNSGSVYIVSNEANGSKTLKGIAATVSSGTITITKNNASKAAFTVEIKTSTSGTVSAWLKNGSSYLYADSSDGLRMVTSSTQTSSSNSGKVWHYKADGKNLLWFFKDTSSSDGYTDTSSTYKYYLNPSSGNFSDAHVDTTSLANTSTPAIYIFEKSDQQSGGGKCTVAVTASKNEVLPGETVTFTVTLLGPVSNVGSIGMFLDIPEGLTYVAESGKLADNLRQTLGFDEDQQAGTGVLFDEATLMISGFGTKNFESQTDTVLATFDCTVDADFSGPATVTLKELEVGDVENWVLLDASALGADITLHVHDWQTTWSWTGSDESGYTAAAATITCKKDSTHTKTVTATVETTTPTTGEDAGYTVYTATVTAADSPDGTAHTDEKRVPVTYVITYDLDGGSVATANPTTYTVESASITLNNPTKAGCTFMGWTGTDLSSAATSVTIAKGSTGNRSYTATWRVDGYDISGNITSYVGYNRYATSAYVEGPVTVVLYRSGTDTVVKEATVSDDNKTYTLTGIANGTYDLVVEKKDHAPRTYEITVSDGAVTQDVEIRLYGDMIDFGEITTVDAAMINSYVQGKLQLTGYDLVVADVLGPNGGPDGEVTTADAAKVNSHARGLTYIW